MDEAKFVDGFDGEDTLSDVEPSDIFGEGIIFNQHGHKITTG